MPLLITVCHYLPAIKITYFVCQYLQYDNWCFKSAWLLATCNSLVFIIRHSAMACALRTYHRCF